MYRTFRMTLLVVLLLCLLGFQTSSPGLAGLVGQVQGEEPFGVTNPTTVLYQGYVTTGGSAYSGTGYFKFIITNAAGNASYWSNDGSSANGSQPTVAVPLAVSNGYFSVLLGDTGLSGMTAALSPSVFAGPGRTLKVWFSTTASGAYAALGPVAIGAVPYALNAETLDGIDSGLLARSDHNHWGASWSSSGIGLSLTSSNNTALLARFGAPSSQSYSPSTIWGDSNIGNNTGTGVLGTSETFIGVYGISKNHIGVIGNATGAADASSGIYGWTNSTITGEGGVFGRSTAAAAGVIGVSASGNGVVGDSNSSAVGIYGGTFSGPSGVRAASEQLSGDGLFAECNSGGNCWGVNAHSNTSYGVFADTNVASGFGLYTPDNAYANAYYTPAGLALLAENSGSEPLQMGDMVAVAGVGSLQSDGKTPLLQVRKLTDGESGGVIGVVVNALRIETVIKNRTEYQAVDQPVEAGPETTGGTGWVARTVEEQMLVQVPVEGAAQPGDFLVIQVQGLAQVRVSTEAGPIQPGDLLTAGTAGLALRAEPFLTADGKTYMYQTGTLLGKALEPLNAGDGLIWVLIDLR